MSLESEIKELKEAVIALTKVIVKDVQQDINEVASKMIEEQSQTSGDKTPVVVTHEMVKDACLELSRSVEGGKDKAKEILKGYDARKASDVPQDKLQECLDKLKGAL